MAGSAAPAETGWKRRSQRQVATALVMGAGAGVLASLGYRHWAISLAVVAVGALLGAWVSRWRSRMRPATPVESVVEAVELPRIIVPQRPKLNLARCESCGFSSNSDEATTCRVCGSTRLVALPWSPEALGVAPPAAARAAGRPWWLRWRGLPSDADLPLTPNQTGLPPEDPAEVEVIRLPLYMSRYAYFDIAVDGVPVTSLADGEGCVLVMEAGEHYVRVSTGSARERSAASVRVVADPSNPVAVRCAASDMPPTRWWSSQPRPAPVQVWVQDDEAPENRP